MKNGISWGRRSGKGDPHAGLGCRDVANEEKMKDDRKGMNRSDPRLDRISPAHERYHRMSPANVRFPGRGLLLLLLFLLLPACREEKAVKRIVQKVQEVPVETRCVETTHLEDTLALEAEVTADESARVAAEIPGRIERIAFRKGAWVEKGKILFEIDRRAIEAQVKQAEVQFDHAERELKRTRRLHAKKLATDQQLSAAQAARDSAEAALELIRVTLDKSTVESPISGIVDTRFLNVGEYAQPGQPVLDIVNLDELVVVAELPEREVPHVHPDQRFDIRVDAFGDEVFSGVFRRVGVQANPNRTFPLEIVVENRDRRLRPGMRAEVTLVRGVYDDAVLIPRDAVLDEFDGKVSFVEVGGRAHRRTVTLGPRSGDQVVVLDGLLPGEHLIVAGHRKLADQTPVLVKRGCGETKR
ncbi:MAG: efflux RND transporter periplasmic adaptor subunit [Deltaproteobacteria bacterium]|nr:MAG: efflux RND transporter periplasmic adaptor subunit [Deltaproteobacteria bacterium]